MTLLFLSVSLSGGEVVHDPGATNAMGSVTAFQLLDSELRERTGYGFTRKPSTGKFRSANGQLSSGVYDYELKIPLLDSASGQFGMYIWKGTGIDCGSAASSQTPVLFPISALRAFNVLVDYSSGQFCFRNIGNLVVKARTCSSGHFAFDFVAIVSAAWQLFHIRGRSPP